ncbi:hypothetical protein JCM8208_003873 [Rhodotorula glutinis]
MDSDRDIPHKVATSFDDSVHNDYIYLYHTVDTHFLDHDPPHFPQMCSIIPGLADKPQAPPKTPDLSTRRAKDPLQSLTGWHRGEHVLDLVSSSSPSSPSSPPARYSLVHNLHALAPEHSMLVPFFDPDGEGPHPFRPQTSRLNEDDLWTAWRVVRAYADEGRETVAFFNGGPLAGASQPHLHIQFLPFQHGRAFGPEHLARSLPALEPVVSDKPGAQPVPARLPVPWVHFYLPLPFGKEEASTTNGDTPSSSSRNGPSSPSSSSTSPSSPSPPSSSPLTPQSLHHTYTSLLSARDALLSSRLAHPDPAVRDQVPPEDKGRRASHNVLLTARHMHLVPRRDRLVVVPRRSGRGGKRGAAAAAAGEGDGEDKKDDNADQNKADADNADDDDDDDDQDSFTISLNGLVYLGFWAAASETDWADLCALGLGEVLTRAAYENDEWQAEGEGA